MDEWTNRQINRWINNRMDNDLIMNGQTDRHIHTYKANKLTDL